MNDTKYQIFISSTYKDLLGVRRKVIESIMSMEHFPVGMELFSAGDDEQWEVIKRTIDNSDYYIVILGHRYGSLAPDGIGYTEKEYDYAKQNGIPILAFVRDRNVPLLEEDRDIDKTRIDAFIEKAMANKMATKWTTEDDLATKVATALYKSFHTHKRSGWVRADKAINPDVANQLARLIKENQELKEELERYRSEEVKAIPDIRVELNDKKSLQITQTDDVVYNPLRRPLEITFAESLGIEEDEIEKYNDGLPTQYEIDEYNTSLREYNYIKENAVDIKITIENNGSMSAKNIKLELEFPEELQVIEKGNITAPKKPSFPKDPRKPSSLITEAAFGLLNWAPYMNNFSGDDAKRLINPNRFNNKYYTVYNDDNTISIRIENLMHFYTYSFNDEYVIVPRQKGVYLVKVYAICEEYRERTEYDFPIEVV